MNVAEVQRGSRRLPPPGLAMAVVLLMALVVIASAWLRLAQPRAPCSEWPGCRSAAALTGARAALTLPAADATFGAASTLNFVRGVHRVAATAVLLLLIALVVVLRRGQPPRHEWLHPAYALLSLALGLSVLGVVTPGSRAATVLLGNLLGGLLMLALALALLVRLKTPHAVSDKLARRAHWAGGLWLLQAAVGALSGAGLVPLAPPVHLALAAAALPMAALAGWSARAEPDRVARALGLALYLIVPLQFVLGAFGANNAAQMGWVLLHNAVAATGLAALGGLMALRRAVSAAAAS